MDNPYSPYVDRSGAAVSWGANPTRKQGPQNFPPLPTFKPYNIPSAMPGVASMVARLRASPANGAASSAGAGTGASGRGAAAPNMIGGIQGIQGIPTMGELPDNVGIGAPPAQIPPPGPPTDGAIAPDSPDQATPPPAPTGGGTVTSNPIIDRLRNPGNGPGIGRRQRTVQY